MQGSNAPCHCSEIILAIAAASPGQEARMTAANEVRGGL